MLSSMRATGELCSCTLNCTEPNASIYIHVNTMRSVDTEDAHTYIIIIQCCAPDIAVKPVHSGHCVRQPPVYSSQPLLVGPVYSGHCVINGCPTTCLRHLSLFRVHSTSVHACALWKVWSILCTRGHASIHPQLALGLPQRPASPWACPLT